MALQHDVKILDDMDGTPGAETTAFAFAGVQYEIDLNEANFNEFNRVLAPYVERARRVGGRKRGAHVKPSIPIGETARVRAWARENGIQVSDRGRISDEIHDAYLAATAGAPGDDADAS